MSVLTGISVAAAIDGMLFSLPAAKRVRVRRAALDFPLVALEISQRLSRRQVRLDFTLLGQLADDVQVSE